MLVLTAIAIGARDIASTTLEDSNDDDTNPQTQAATQKMATTRVYKTTQAHSSAQQATRTH